MSITRTLYTCMMEIMPPGRYWECFMEVTLPPRKESTHRQTICFWYSNLMVMTPTPASVLPTTNVISQVRIATQYMSLIEDKTYLFFFSYLSVQSLSYPCFVTSGALTQSAGFKNLHACLKLIELAQWHNKQGLSRSDEVKYVCRLIRDLERPVC